MAQPTPSLGIPSSSSTVSVSLIDTTAEVVIKNTADFMQPVRKGIEVLELPDFAFLIRNKALNRTIIYDLGIRHDVDGFSPATKRMLQKGGYGVKVESNVRDILESQGFDTSQVEAVVWSHWHFDHTGDMSVFGPDTALVVGPGFCDVRNGIFPGYPANEASPILESDYAGRELREISFTDSGISVGRMPAFDYFGDGSFYLVDAPGHAVGHLCGLARVTTSPRSSFVFLGGDGCHHMSQLRPSAFRNLPDVLDPSPLRHLPVCPGAMFEPLLRREATDEPDRGRALVEISTGPNSVHADPAEAARTVAKMQEVDAVDDVFVVIAHDRNLKGLVDPFPATLDDFAVKGWQAASRWSFLTDFVLDDGDAGICATGFVEEEGVKADKTWI